MGMANRIDDHLDKLHQEHLEKMIALQEELACLESIRRIEAREKAGLCEYRPAEEYFTEFEKKHGIKRV